jgi:outer membrane protein TolC
LYAAPRSAWPRRTSARRSRFARYGTEAAIPTCQPPPPFFACRPRWASNRRAAVAGFDRSAAEYRETVLHAFRDVADVLRAMEFDARTLAAQVDAEAAARETLEIAKTQVRLGAASHLSLLDAQRQYHLSRILRVQAQAARYADTAALFQALGGGWWSREQPIAGVAKP